MLKKIEDIGNHEYLLTNGLGGYCFSSIDGTLCRKYHSLMTVSLAPPVQRLHLVSKCEEVVKMGDRRFQLSYENTYGRPETPVYVTDFEKRGAAVHVFESEGVHVKRKTAMKYGSNQVSVVYEVHMPEDGELRLTPFYHFRDHHDVDIPSLEDYALKALNNNVYQVTHTKHSVYVQTDAQFTPDRRLSDESYYPIETDRGYPNRERHVILGSFTQVLKKGFNRISISFHTSEVFSEPYEVFEERNDRYDALIAKSGFKNAHIRQLVQSADDFIVYRKSTGKKTILAGYPWFTDWGRDTMIALPGLTLSTKRYDEGLEMIEGFMAYVHRGIIPNNFPDEGQAPMYNTADGTLWLFNAMYLYYQHTKDKAAVKRLLPDMLNILKHHMTGTMNDIYMDTDGLLVTGNPETQLTWMDVKVDGWVVTPRHGKAVEINALWYNAICITMSLAEAVGSEAESHRMGLEALSRKIKASFHDAFYNEAAGNLYDLVIDGVPYDIPRPNMIFAVSLPFAVLEEAYFKSLVDYVTDHFKVPYGLLTLAQDDPDFQGFYSGSLLQRDGAYHRGTAWAWLLGPYFDAHHKAYGDKKAIKEAIDVLFDHLDEGIHGSISEIFEGNAPHKQKGCSAQAWSVAEILRIWDALSLDSLTTS